MDKLNIEKAIELSHDLATEISKDFTPDLIIAIGNGGILTGVEISNQLNKPLHKIIVGRINNKKFEEQYAVASDEGRKEISNVFNELWFEKNPELLSGVSVDLKGKKVLLVDDAVHSGKTMEVAREYLLTLHPLIIKTATLFYVDKYTPDYFMGQGEISYPWSTWAKFDKDYKLYEEYLKKHGQVLP